MSIYEIVGERAKRKDERFNELCDEVAIAFAGAVVAINSDLSTPELVKAAVDSFTIDVASLTPIIQVFIENLKEKPRMYDKFSSKTALVLKNNKLMTLERSKRT